MNQQNTASRYEFRHFAKEFGPLVNHIERSHPPVSRAESTDLYLLAAANPDYSVKLRHGKLDTKVLTRRERGLERWCPHLQIDFPLTAALLHEFVFPWLRIDSPALLRSSYTIQQLRNEVLTATPDLQIVKVHKQRSHYLLYGCQIEIGDLCINDQTELRTVAVEATQPQLVTRTVETLDLQDYQNTNYVVGLLQLLAAEQIQPKQTATAAQARQPAPQLRQAILMR